MKKGKYIKLMDKNNIVALSQAYTTCVSETFLWYLFLKQVSHNRVALYLGNKISETCSALLIWLQIHEATTERELYPHLDIAVLILPPLLADSNQIKMAVLYI